MRISYDLQATIRREFRDTTILTIAHRINTIMDSDFVVLLSEGRILETGNPMRYNSSCYSCKLLIRI